MAVDRRYIGRRYYCKLETFNLKCAMKKLRRILLATVVAIVAASCTSAYYTAGSSAYDDLYASHNRTEIANRQKAEAEARRAEAEARKAEAEALQAEYEAKIAAFNAQAAAEGKQTIKTQTASTLDEVIVLEDNSTQSFVADSYESAYARRLRGFRSPSYRMPSSYFNLRYTGDVMLATAYDPAFYNIMVSGDQVWVEPRYITSMFGTWGATNATALIYSPWYYGWNTRWGVGWGAFDPWYYSSWGFPRYSWYDWNWNICYGGGWGVNLWWGWGGHYHPWRPAYHHHHHYHNPWDAHWHIGPGNIAGGGGHWRGSLRGTRLDNGPVNASSNSQHLRKPSIVRQGAINSSPYRSPNNGSAYGTSTRKGSVTSAIIKQNQQQSSSSRGQSSSLRSGNVNNRTSQSIGRGNTTSLRNNNTSLINRDNNSNNRNNSMSNSNSNRNNSSSSNRSSSYNSGSSHSSGSSFSSGSSSRGGGGSYGGSSGGGRSGGSRGR